MIVHLNRPQTMALAGVMDIFRSALEPTKSNLARKLRVSQRTAARRISDLVNLGIIDRSDCGPGRVGRTEVLLSKTAQIVIKPDGSGVVLDDDFRRAAECATDEPVEGLEEGSNNNSSTNYVIGAVLEAVGCKSKEVKNLSLADFDEQSAELKVPRKGKGKGSSSDGRPSRASKKSRARAQKEDAERSEAASTLRSEAASVNSNSVLRTGASPSCEARTARKSSAEEMERAKDEFVIKIRPYKAPFVRDERFAPREVVWEMVKEKNPSFYWSEKENGIVDRAFEILESNINLLRQVTITALGETWVVERGCCPQLFLSGVQINRFRSQAEKVLVGRAQRDVDQFARSSEPSRRSGCQDASCRKHPSLHCGLCHAEVVAEAGRIYANLGLATPTIPKPSMRG